jgi:hypothetical protein
MYIADSMKQIRRLGKWVNQLHTENSNSIIKFTVAYLEYRCAQFILASNSIIEWMAFLET